MSYQTNLRMEPFVYEGQGGQKLTIDLENDRDLLQIFQDMDRNISLDSDFLVNVMNYIRSEFPPDQIARDTFFIENKNRIISLGQLLSHNPPLVACREMSLLLALYLNHRGIEAEYQRGEMVVEEDGKKKKVPHAWVILRRGGIILDPATMGDRVLLNEGITRESFDERVRAGEGLARVSREYSIDRGLTQSVTTKRAKAKLLEGLTEFGELERELPSPPKRSERRGFLRRIFRREKSRKDGYILLSTKEGGEEERKKEKANRTRKEKGRKKDRKGYERISSDSEEEVKESTPPNSESEHSSVGEEFDYRSQGTPRERKPLLPDSEESDPELDLSETDIVTEENTRRRNVNVGEYERLPSDSEEERKESGSESDLGLN